jgi:hypothetical protein
MECGSKIHAPADLPPGKNPGVHWVGNVVDFLEKIFCPSGGFELRTVKSNIPNTRELEIFIIEGKIIYVFRRTSCDTLVVAQGC